MLDAKIVVPIVGSVTVISLAIILVVIPNLLGKDPCTEFEAPGSKVKYCQGQPLVQLEPSVPPDDIGLPASPPAPTNTTEIADSIERGTAEATGTFGSGELPLNSITGNWNVEGQTRDGLQFFGTFTFGENNQFATIYNIIGYVQPAQYGTYEYSSSQSTLTLTYYGQAPDFYTVKDISENSFRIEGAVGTATFVRI